MKISSVSKKVLASALSAAMVVAFAPTVAFGAQATGTGKINVTYDFGEGAVDSGTDTNQFLKAEDKVTIVSNASAVIATAEEPAYIAFSNSGSAPASITETNLIGGYDDGSGYKLYAQFNGETAAIYDLAGLTDSTKRDFKSEVKYAAGTKDKAVTTLGTYAAATAELSDATPYLWAIPAFYSAPYGTENWVAIETDFEPASQMAIDTADCSIAIQQVGTKTVNGVNVKQLTKGGYEFDHWEYYFDANGDGDYDDADKGDVKSSKITGTALDVSDGKFGAGCNILVKAVYDAPALNEENFTFTQVSTSDALKGLATIKPQVEITKASKGIAGTYTVELAKDGSVVATKQVGLTALVKFDEMAAEVGEYTMTLKDPNGLALDKKTLLIGAVEISGGYFTSRTNENVNVASQTVYYVASKTAGKTYSEILAGCGVDITAVKDPSATPLVHAANLYTADGKVAATLNNGTPYSYSTTEGVKKGAITTQLTSFFKEEGIVSASEKDGTFSVVTYGEATANKVGFYLTLTDPSGKVIREDSSALALGAAGAIPGFTAIDTDVLNNTAVGEKNTGTPDTNFVTYTFNLSNTLAAGDYTATLYKVTEGTAAHDATVKTVASKAITVSTVAAPAWAYTADADTTKGGTLVLTNNAGDKYDVKFTVDGTTTTYTSTTGIKVISLGKDYTIQATKKASVTEDVPAASKAVVLFGYNQAGAWTDVDTFTKQVAVVTVNGSKTVVYGADQGVKDAIAAAKKVFTDKGFAQGTAADTAAKVWAADVVSTEKAVLNAVAGVAKAEVEKLYAGITAADGSVTKISSDNNEKAVAAIDAVLAAFDANTNAVTTDNVTKVNDVAIDGSGTAYAKAIDAAVKSAQAAAVKYAKADVDAAAAVTAQLKDPKTAAAGLEAYANLSAAAKELVAAADLKAAQAQVVVDAQDEGTLNKLSTTKKKTVALKGAKKTKKAVSVSYTTKVSKSGNKVTYAKKSGSSRITVAKSGKVTLKKGTKKGTFTAKVKATCGTQTRTVNVKFTVKA